MEELNVAWVEQNVGSVACGRIFLYKRFDDLFQANVPNNEEEPVAHDEFALSDETWAHAKVVRHFSDWFAMRTVLFQVLYQVQGLDALDEVLQIVEYVRVQGHLEGRRAH